VNGEPAAQDSDPTQFDPFIYLLGRGVVAESEDVTITYTQGNPNPYGLQPAGAEGVEKRTHKVQVCIGAGFLKVCYETSW
jgi:hypothetical protein